MSRWKMPFEWLCSIAFSNWYMYPLIFNSGKWDFRFLIHSYKFMSINSNTRAKRPVGSSLIGHYYITSINLMILACGDKRRKAWISRRLFTFSIESKWFFMHFIATCLPVRVLWALNTSLKVPSPFFEMSRYSDYHLLCIILYHFLFRMFNYKLKIACKYLMISQSHNTKKSYSLFIILEIPATQKVH